MRTQDAGGSGMGAGRSRAQDAGGSGMGAGRSRAQDAGGSGMVSMVRARAVCRHVVVAGVALAVVLGIPFLCSDAYRSMRLGVDAVSSASLLIEQPSGAYLVLINPARHPDADKLATWMEFFSGEEIGYIFEDIVCGVAKSDAQGMELARSFQSRLPEHQMEIHSEDATLMLSKAERGTYDILILSQEAADAYHAETVVTAADAVTITLR